MSKSKGKKQKPDPIIINLWEPALPEIPKYSEVIINLFASVGPRTFYLRLLRSTPRDPNDFVFGCDYLLRACYRDYQEWRRQRQPLSGWEEWAGIERLLRLYERQLGRYKSCSVKMVREILIMIDPICIKMLAALRQELYHEPVTAWEEADQLFSELVVRSGQLKDNAWTPFSTTSPEGIEPLHESYFLEERIFSPVHGAYSNKLRNQDDFDRAMKLVKTIGLKRLEVAFDQETSSVIRIKGRLYKAFSPPADTQHEPASHPVSNSGPQS